MRSPPRSFRSAAAGYTAVEIMMALTVMTIGAAAVMSLQKTSVTGNFDARETDLAASIARTWVDRLHRDAMNWTMPNNTYPAANNFTNAKLLSLPTYGQWTLPNFAMNQTTPETMSYAFDMLGRDIPQGSATSNGQAPNPTNPVVFCVNYRLEWLVPPNLTPPPGGPAVEPGLIRVDLRVLWPRDIVGRPANDWCTSVSVLNDPEVNDPPGQYPTYHALYLTTTIRQGGTGQ
jgi:type II secretory pathway pseudopilin PulG